MTAIPMARSARPVTASVNCKTCSRHLTIVHSSHFVPAIHMRAKSVTKATLVLPDPLLKRPVAPIRKEDVTIIANAPHDRFTGLPRPFAMSIQISAPHIN